MQLGGSFRHQSPLDSRLASGARKQTELLDSREAQLARLGRVVRVPTLVISERHPEASRVLAISSTT